MIGQRIRLGGSELEVSRLCLGGNVFGWTASENESFAVLDAYLDAGGNFIDTADVYTNWHPGNIGGESERIIGRWLRSRGGANEVVVATKGGMLAPNEGLSRQSVSQAIDGSLKRLGIDSIDLWFTHRDDESLPLEETAEALDDAVRAGKVKYVAASNVGAARLVAAMECAAAMGTPSYRAIQIRHNLINRTSLSEELIAAIETHHLALMTYSALAEGILTGKYDRAGLVDTGRDAVRSKHDHAKPATHDILAAQRAVAARHGVPATSVAIAWLIAQPHVGFVVASARRTQQLPAILDGLELTLTTEDLTALNG